MAATAARDGQTALALRLVKLLAPADAATDGNVAFSPVSVHAALALLAAAARGATLDELLAFLGAPHLADLANFGRRVADRVLADRADSGGPRVLFGGGVWIDAERGRLRNAFREVAAESYKSEARTVSFTKEPEEAVKMINNWVKEATGNLIDSIFSRNDITAETDLVLANAVYFKGAWLNPFNSFDTYPGTFHRFDGSCVKAEFMSSFEYSRYILCMDGFKILKLPYEQGHAQAGEGQAPLNRRRGQDPSAKTSPDSDDTQYSMFVFLPDERGGIATMVDVITAAPRYLYNVLPELKVKHVHLQLPKFEINFDWDLRGDLRRLGLSLPFSPEEADLRGMFENDDDERPTFLNKVAHRAVVNVNEAGTEAAAVTGAMRGGGGLLPDTVEFVADHPFTFFIMEERSGVIVFAGHVLDPTK